MNPAAPSTVPNDDREDAAATGQSRDFTNLLERLDAYALDRPEDAETFSRRLRRETGWSAGKAARAIQEYKRFCALAAAAGHPVSPSDIVDQVWHLHLIDTRRYWQEFCPHILGRPFHHEPSHGGAEETARLKGQYAATLASYERLFGEPPPEDIWPRPDGVSGWRRVRHWLAVRHGLLALTLLAIAGCSALLDSSSPGAIQGPDFLIFYAVLSVAALGGMILLQARAIESWSAPAMEPGSLGAYELAFLAGSGRRVFETALLRLHVQGHVRFDKKGKVVQLEKALPDTAPPIEAALAAAISAGSAMPALSAISQPLADLRERLEGGGLIPGKPARRAAWKVALLVLLPLLCLGGLRCWFGVLNHRPVGGLVAMMIIVPAIGVVVTRIRIGLTHAGRRVRRDLGNEILPGQREADDPLLPRAVALYGVTTVLVAAPFADFRRFIKIWGAQSGGSDGGSSCGGGDGGGGGCGG